MAFDMTLSRVGIKLMNVPASIDAAWQLLEMHREELTTNKEIMELEPRREVYQNLHDTGSLFGLGLYIGDQLVGYSVNIVGQNLHYGGLTVSQNDLFFVHPDYRSRYGLRLMRETEKQGKARYAPNTPFMQLWHAKPRTPFHSILERLKYQVQDVIYSKVID
jgi:hypothetical protein